MLRDYQLRARSPSRPSWGGERTVYGPSGVLDSSPDRFSVNSSLGRPFVQGKRAPVVRVPKRVPLVVVLDDSRCPTTVAIVIAARVVDPIQQQAGWLVSHISKERLKPQPFIADGNPAPAVVGVTLVALVQAPLEHVGPGPVSPVARVPVCRITFDERVAHKAAARANDSRHQVPGRRFVSIAAFAQTSPTRTFDVFHCREPRELLTGDVLHVRV